MDFITQLFDQLNSHDSWVVILWLLLAFLIGWFFHWLLSRNTIGKLTGDLDRRKNEYNALNAKYNGKAEEVNLQAADLKKVNLELEELHAQIRQLESEKGQLHGDLYACKDERSKLEAELAGWGDKESTYNSQLSGLNSQILGLQGQVDGAPVDLSAKVAELEGANSQLQVDLDACKAKAAAAPKMAMAAAPPVDKAAKAAQARADVKAALGAKIASASADEKDDLKRINGVGPFIEKKLNTLGIFTYKQVSQFDEDLSNNVTDAIEFFPGRIQRDNWVGQAAKLHQMKLDGTLNAKTKNPSNPEDLKIVEGIGPKIEQLLKGDGLHNWTDLAAASVERLQGILNAAGDRYKMHNPSTWAEQAEMAAKGQWKKLKEYQDYLVGGRDVKK